MWYRQGVDKGYSEGHDLGFSEGHDLGFSEGHDLGFSEGHDLGFSERHDLGFNEGRERGALEQKSKDRELMRELAKRLSEQGRTEEFAQAMSDEALLAKLVKECGLEHRPEA